MVFGVVAAVAAVAAVVFVVFVVVDVVFVVITVVVVVVVASKSIFNSKIAKKPVFFYFWPVFWVSKDFNFFKHVQRYADPTPNW